MYNLPFLNERWGGGGAPHSSALYSAKASVTKAKQHLLIASHAYMMHFRHPLSPTYPPYSVLSILSPSLHSLRSLSHQSTHFNKPVLVQVQFLLQLSEGYHSAGIKDFPSLVRQDTESQRSEDEKSLEDRYKL